LTGLTPGSPMIACVDDGDRVGAAMQRVERAWRRRPHAEW
jgi:hypothetical protein